ncbi:hypothetical protein BD779DRAFT_1667030 [Infundibulicybe gibba]|nr:hypothetical protein BD779DRAFT_1667030 [Infundibulicybe gibba]
MFYRTIVALSLLFTIGVANVGAAVVCADTNTITDANTDVFRPAFPDIHCVPKNRVRMVILSKRAPNITNEEFSIYWANSHSKLFSSLAIVKKNLLKYEQAHTNLPFIPSINAIGFPTASGMIFEDEEYKTRVIPDELKFADRPACQFLPFDLFEVLPKQHSREIGA